MKKIFTLLSIALSSGLLAQNFSAYQTNNAQTINTATLTNGSAIENVTSVTTNTASPVVSSLKVKLVNNSASTITLTVVRRIVAQMPALKLDGNGNLPDTYFCFGYQCFPSNVTSPGPSDYAILGPAGTNIATCCSGSNSTCCTPTFTGVYDNTKENGTPFVIDLAEGLMQGYYIVNYKVFDINNTADSISFTVRYNSFLSVQENNEAIESIGNLYPNPTTNNAQFSLILKQESPVKMQVYNSLGSLVYSSNEQKLMGKNKLSIDCSNFNSGLYFVTVTAGDSKITRRLVVNK